MISEQSTFFPKQIKLDDYESPTEDNLIRIMETSNLLLGNGGKSSTTSIIMSKALHFMQQQGTIQLSGKQILELGCGAGLLGIYLGCLGSNVIMTDLPVIKDMTERNINLNRQMIKGEVQFAVVNWKNANPNSKNNSGKIEGQMEKQKQEGVSTSSSDLSLIKGFDKIDYTIACQTGNIDDMIKQLQWIGREGMIVGFQERTYHLEDQYMNAHQLESYLLENSFQYQKLDNYHPDYFDERIFIYKIWK